MQLLAGTYVSYGISEHSNYVRFGLNGVSFEVSSSFNPFWFNSFYYKIFVGGIKAYDKGWIHDITDAIKRRIDETVDLVEQFNKEHSASINEAHLNREEMYKRIKNDKFTEEKERLSKMFL